jgi:hypothetical protein
MLKISPLLTAAALSLCAVLAFAQEAPTAEKPAAPVKTADAPRIAANTTQPRSRTKPATTEAEAPVPEIIATPQPKKPGFFKRLFSPRKPKEEAGATPEPTTTPTPTPRRIVRSAGATPEPEKPKSSVAVKPPQPVAASPTPPKTAPKVAAKPKAPEPPADADPEVQEKFRFDQARAKAGEDPQIQALKAKADNAATEEESQKALRAYNKALFDKIRKTDKSVTERANRLEAAIMKRLSE